MTTVSRYVRSGRRTVEGWLSYGACDMIVRINESQLTGRVTGHVAEIGVHHGRLFILLHLLTRADEKVIAIDLFENQDANVDGSGEGDYEKFMHNVQRHVGSTSRTVVHRGNSTDLDGEMVRAMAGGPIRLFSVDGGHTEQITRHDLQTAQDSLSEGGVVILDDCFNAGWPGVVSGVFRFLQGGHGIRPFAVGANKTLFAAGEFCGKYREVLRATYAKSTTQEFFGHKVICLDYEGYASIILRLRQTGWWRQIKDTEFGARLKRAYAKVQASRG